MQADLFPTFRYALYGVELLLIILLSNLVLQIQRALAAQGLKDPWLRNEVWRYNRQLIGPQNWSTTWGRIMFRKFPVGLALAAGTVALEMAYDSYNGSGDHGHGHGEHH